MEAAAVGTGQLGRGGDTEVQAMEERTLVVMAEDTPEATVVAAEVPKGAWPWRRWLQRPAGAGGAHGGGHSQV